MAANNNSSNLEAYGQDPCCQNLAKLDITSAEGGMQRLALRHVLGFNGKIVNGLVVHPLGKHLVYALGRHVIIEELSGKCPGRQEMLVGHLEDVSALAVSYDGSLVVSAQKNLTRDERSMVILWDFCSRRKLMQRNLHKETTARLVFTCSSRYFVSLGGDVDESLCVWDTTERKPLVSKNPQVRRVGPMLVIKASHVDPSMFISVGESYGRIWKFDRDTTSMSFQELTFGSLVRKVLCAEIGDKDMNEPPRIFCGTSSCSILVFHGQTGILMTEILTPRLCLGVTCLSYVRMLDHSTYCMAVGSGEGKIGYYKFRMEMRKGNKFACKMDPYPGTSLWHDPQSSSCVTSISKLGVGQQFFVGFHQSHIRRFNLEPWGNQLVRTCSNRPINDAAFARGTDDLLVTGEFEKIRVYNLKAMLEVRRYVRANRDCFSVCLRHDGTNIFTGWDSGEVLVLGFESKGLGLHELYRIDRADRNGVSCLALTSVSDTLISGGSGGFVTVWSLLEDFDLRGRRLRQGIQKFHFVDQRGPITCVRLSADDQVCIATSLDGQVVSYSLASGQRLKQFKFLCGLTSVTFCQTDLQAVTSTTDGYMQWLDLVNGQELRQLLGSSSGGVLAMDTEPKNRQIIATGGDDKLVKLWDIDEGVVRVVGEGHSNSVNLIKFGPCGSILLTAGKDGSVCMWDVPPLKS